MKKIFCGIVFLLFAITRLLAQDPSFSQFFSSPLNINPALTGNINADWRAISNFRDQWIGPATPYVTGTISYDRRLFEESSISDKNSFGVGGMLMFDRAMAGVQKSTYASLNLGYALRLSDNEIKHSLGIGFGTIYGSRRIDYSRLDFEEQFTGSGFDTNLPTGEAALSNMKPYFSVSGGLTYSIKSETSNIDIGVAGFHLNKPKQTFLEDERQVLPIRKVAHINFDTYLSEQWILNTNAIYQSQLGAEYYSVGGSLGYYIGGAENTILNGGLWYWSNNAIVPYVGLAFKNLQFGLSYDWTISKLRNVSQKAKTFEMSIILRGEAKPSGIKHCPWK